MLDNEENEALLQGMNHEVSVNRFNTSQEDLTSANTTNMPSMITAKKNQEDMEALAGAAKTNDNNDELRDNMTILECYWMVTKMAVPLIFGFIL